MIKSKNMQAFLDMIAHSELGDALIAASDNGYNVLVGSTPDHPLLFPTLADGTPNYSTHPNILNKELNSTAAGRYQLLHRYYTFYAKSLDLNDFGHDSQDRIALQQIMESYAFHFIEGGFIEQAIKQVAHIWASLPGSPYGQHTNNLSDLLAVYAAKGGQLTETTT